MNEDQNNSRSYEEEINIKVYVMELWKDRVMIICFTLIAAILAGLYSFLLITPVYDTNLDIVLNMPEKYNTKFGEYTLPITTNQQYMGLIVSNDVILNTIRDMDDGSSGETVEDVKRRIKLSKMEKDGDNKQNSFIITISDSTPSKSLKLAEALYKNYVNFMEAMILDKAVTSFYNKFTTEIKTYETTLKSRKDILAKNKELLVRTPKTINQKEAMKAIQDQPTNARDFIVLENIINPNYTKLESDIIENEQDINNIIDTINVLKGYVQELNDEKSIIGKYYSKEEEEVKLNTELINVIDSNIFLPSPPVLPANKTSPSNATNIAFGAVLGCMIGIIISLIKKFWFAETSMNNKTFGTK